MNHVSLFFPLAVLLPAFVYGQGIVDPKSIEAIRSTSPISVDGVLSEPPWQRPGRSDFTQRDPDEGASPSQRTEVWVAFDDEAIYFAARMHDTSSDSIVPRVGRRDADLSADWIYFSIDSYHDKRNGFFFGVTAGGSVQDGIHYNDEWTDGSWDGVWDVATTIDSDGWTAEYRVPYSQLRFPEREEYIWGINILRIIDRRKEEDFFVMVPKEESGGVSRFAELRGIRNINPPARMEVVPYLAGGGKFLKHTKGDPFNDGSILTNSIGADVKIGIGSNLTLNATFNPDFGQVEVDPAVVNLTQYETFFDEKRLFFVEGSNFFSFGSGGANNNWGFNWGSPSYFYSRRIGRPPRGSVQHSGFKNIPDRTHILGAAKLTGKLSEGWSIGTLHSVTAREYGEVDSMGVRFQDVVEPLAYNGVVRSLFEVDDGRRAIGILGTMAARELNQPYLVDHFNKRAAALGVDGWTTLDADRMFVATGWFATTRVEGTPSQIRSVQESFLHYYHRPDAVYLDVDPNATSLSGYAGRLAVNKQKGNLRFHSAFGIISPGFNTNDLGFLFRTDVINMHVVTGYQWYEPDGTFRRKGFNVATFRNFNFGGTKIGEGYFLFYHGQFMNYWGLEGNLMYQPSVYDDRNTRGGPVMKNTTFYGSNWYAYSDWRESVVANFSFFAGRSESGGYRVTVGPGAEWKPSSRVSVGLSPTFTRDVTIAQWVTKVDDSTAVATYGARYIFGKLDQKEFAASIRMDWTFTPKLSLQLFLQPLLSVGGYSEFKELARPGVYAFNRYGPESVTPTNGEYTVDPDGSGPAQPLTFSDPDFSFKSLRANAVLRWEYMPGSTVFLVWTQERTNFNDPGDYRFGRDFSNLISSVPDNVLLLKVTYWLNP
jgi:hypothetical protein